MITDDPGTPGNNKWEVNIAWMDQRSPGETQPGLAQRAANYGVGDRIEINYQTNWEINKDVTGSHSGMDDSQLAVKWRFYDAGEHGWQVSMYPRITFLTPGTNSDQRGVADDAKVFLMPFEATKDFGGFSIGFDCGHIFSSHSGGDGWDRFRPRDRQGLGGGRRNARQRVQPAESHRMHRKLWHPD